MNSIFNYSDDNDELINLFQSRLLAKDILSLAHSYEYVRATFFCKYISNHLETKPVRTNLTNCKASRIRTLAFLSSIRHES